MYLQHFGLKFDPLGKKSPTKLEQSRTLEKKLNGLLETRGLALITGASGTGKTTALRRWSETLNPLTHRLIYQSDNHFRSFDVYSQLAENLGLEKYHRYSKLWRELKQALLSLYEEKQLHPVWVLDEAHHLNNDFFLQLPAFLNFSFDSRDVLTIILCGLPNILSILRRPAYEPINSRIQCFLRWEAIDDQEQFSGIINLAFQNAGCRTTLITETGMRLIHLGSKGRLRYADRILRQALQIAADKQLSHVPDDVIHAAIDSLKG